MVGKKSKSNASCLAYLRIPKKLYLKSNLWTSSRIRFYFSTILVCTSTRPIFTFNPHANKTETRCAKQAYSVLTIICIFDKALTSGAQPSVWNCHCKSILCLRICINLENSVTGSISNQSHHLVTSLAETVWVPLPSPHFSTLYAEIYCSTSRALNSLRVNS